MSRARTDPLAVRWRDLVERRLPDAAVSRPEWPVRHDHCFAHILLDHACDGPWRAHVRPPAWANLADEHLAAAVVMGEAVLRGESDLGVLNRRSLIWRGKLRALPAEAARASGGPCFEANP